MDTNVPQAELPACLLGLTIDGPLSRDLDDAVWLEEANGRPLVRVCIADVASDIPAGSPLDLRAREKGFTRYFATGNAPMLPRRLTEDALSLLPDHPRRVLCIDMTLDDALDTADVQFRPAAFRSAAQLTYAQASEIVGGKAAPERHDIAPMLMSLAVLADRLMQKRRRRGELAFYDLLKGWTLTEEGRLRPLKADEANIGYIIVQELMLLTNRTVAEFLLHANVPTLFRNHEARLAAPERADLLHDIEAAMARPDLYSLDTLTQRLNLTLSTARYGPKLKGHYGLNLPAYLHFTSPIRRYADLVNQRILLAHLRGLPPPYKMEELEAIGQELNTLADAQRARVSERYKQRKQAETARSLRAEAAHIAKLPDKDVYRVLESAAEQSERSAALAQAVRLRFASGAITLKEVFLLLFVWPQEGEEGKQLRQEGLDWLRRQPDEAVSVLAMGIGLRGWKAVKYQQAAHGTAFQCCASLAQGKSVYQSDVVYGSKKKEAQQKAALALCYALCGFAPPDEAAPPPPAAPMKKAAASAGLDWESLRKQEAAGDWVSALFQACKKTNQKSPRFRFEKGEDKYHCWGSVTWRGQPLEGEGEAELKQQAKQQAARTLMQGLHTLEERSEP